MTLRGLFPQREMPGVGDEVAVEHIRLDAVLVAVELVLESGSLSAEHILNVVARLAATEPPPSVETHLSLKEAPIANTARYDRLRGQAEEVGHA
jgi:hypothetical protein